MSGAIALGPFEVATATSMPFRATVLRYLSVPLYYRLLIVRFSAAQTGHSGTDGYPAG